MQKQKLKAEVFLRKTNKITNKVVEILRLGIEAALVFLIYIKLF